jgi:hypothetical protein
MSGRMRVQEKFSSYLAKVIPVDADEEQVIEYRRAFFAGASTLFRIFMDEIADTDSGVSQSDKMTVLNEIAEELKVFSNDVRNGRA